MSLTMNTAIPTDASSAFDWFLVRLMLPHRGCMAMLDGIEQCTPECGRITAYKLVAGNDPMVNSHDPGDPSLPSPVVVEAMAQPAAR